MRRRGTGRSYDPLPGIVYARFRGATSLARDVIETLIESHGKRRYTRTSGSQSVFRGSWKVGLGDYVNFGIGDENASCRRQDDTLRVD